MPGISLTIRRTEEGRYCAMILPESAPDLGGEVHPEPVESETLDDLMSQVGERVQRIFEIGSGALAKTPPVNYRRFGPPDPDAGTLSEDAEDAEDAADVAAYDAGMEDIQRTGGVPWEQVKAELGL